MTASVVTLDDEALDPDASKSTFKRSIVLPFGNVCTTVCVLASTAKGDVKV